MFLHRLLYLFIQMKIKVQCPLVVLLIRVHFFLFVTASHTHNIGHRATSILRHKMAELLMKFYPRIHLILINLYLASFILCLHLLKKTFIL